MLIHVRTAAKGTELTRCARVGRAPGRRRSHDEEAVPPAARQFIFPSAGLHVAPAVQSLRLLRT